MQPRRILPGTRWMITRRCAQRTFRLRPSPLTNAVFRYCLAIAEAKTGVLTHAFCVMSNHMHLIVTDVLGRLPEFVRELDRMVAKVMNALQGQWESLWSSEPPHYLELASDDDVIGKMAYVIANPVSAGLVERPDDWPGVLIWATNENVETVVARPQNFFRAKGPCPSEATFRIVPPAGIENLSERLDAEVSRLLELAHAEMRQKRLVFLGRQRVMKTSFSKRAKSLEQKRGLVPRVAAKSMYLRVALLGAYREFLKSYHAAMERWRLGARDVVFPEGTWWMRVFHGVREVVATPPAELREAPT